MAVPARANECRTALSLWWWMNAGIRVGRTIEKRPLNDSSLRVRRWKSAGSTGRNKTMMSSPLNFYLVARVYSGGVEVVESCEVRMLGRWSSRVRRDGRRRPRRMKPHSPAAGASVGTTDANQTSSSYRNATALLQSCLNSTILLSAAFFGDILHFHRTRKW
jgi:hypothetical protein